MLRFQLVVFVDFLSALIFKCIQK